MECPRISAEVKDGEVLEADLIAGTILNTASGKSLKFTPIAAAILEILDQGSIIPFTKVKLAT